MRRENRGECDATGAASQLVELAPTVGSLRPLKGRGGIAITPRNNWLV